VGIIAEMAFDPQRDDALAAIAATHLFEGNTTRVAIRRDNWIRGFEYDFMELLAPQLTRRMVEATLKGEGADPGL
jgi:LysR family cys regulon transcriptional activator